MIVVLCVSAFLLVLAGGWGLRRHHVSVAWDRELEQAFGVSADREMPAHRVL